MKKLFVSILALAAFAACQSNFNDVDYDTPEFGGVGNVGGSHTIYAEVGVGEETKATYGDDLSALWEEGDQIALLQEHADYGKTFSVENIIGIKNGIGTSVASFSGDISVDSTDPRIYHIVYPGSAAEFNVTMSQSVEGVSYTNHQPGMNNWSATGYAKCTYNSTVNVVVPTSQSGKWEPYLYASTDEAVKSEAIGAETLNTLTGAIAIRAVKPDGVTPLQLKAVAVTATKPIAGVFAGTATSVGNTVEITGEKSGLQVGGLEQFEKETKDKALANLTSALQGYEATTTSVTKTLSLAFEGDQYTVGAEDTAWVDADEKGVYTYHLNVAPFEGADLTIMATAMDGSTLVKTISAQSLAAGHRKGYVFKWEEATLSVGSIETWYDDCDTTIGLEGNTLYVNNLEVKGVEADQVLTLGVVIDGTLHEATAKNNVLTIDQIKVSGMASNQHTVYAYAKVIVNGQERELIGSVATKTITSIPTITGFTVKTSYSNDGTVAKDNNFDGNKMTMNADISDAYFKTAGLVKSYTFYYGNKSVNPTLGTAKDVTFAPSEWGQYDCYVNILLKNGYSFSSTKYTTHVTGIPYTFQFYQSSNSAVDNAGWTRNGTVNIKESLLALREGGLAGSGNGWVASPAFHIPAAFSTSVTIDSKYYSTSGALVKAKLYIGATSSATTTASSYQTIEIKGTVNTSSGSEWKNNTVTVSMPAGKQHTSINHNGATSGAGSRIYVAKFAITY
ncbi:MAG: hypothetical protein E7147_01215 [Rikenellaceae bacterium]|nr:hypothetical protein [Rikenellaceae bacterium]